MGSKVPGGLWVQLRWSLCDVAGTKDWFAGMRKTQGGWLQQIYAEKNARYLLSVSGPALAHVGTLLRVLVPVLQDYTLTKKHNRAGISPDGGLWKSYTLQQYGAQSLKQFNSMGFNMGFH